MAADPSGVWRGAPCVVMSEARAATPPSLFNWDIQDIDEAELKAMFYQFDQACGKRSLLHICSPASP